MGSISQYMPILSEWFGLFSLLHLEFGWSVSKWGIQPSWKKVIFGWVSLLDIAYGDYSVVKFNRISNPHWSLGVAIGLQPLINCLTVHVKAWITYGSMTSKNSDARNDKKMSSSGPNSKPKSQPRHSDVPSKFLQATCPLIHTDPTKIPKSRAPKIRFWSSLQHLPAPSLQVAWLNDKNTWFKVPWVRRFVELRIIWNHPKWQCGSKPLLKDPKQRWDLWIWVNLMVNLMVNLRVNNPNSRTSNLRLFGDDSPYTKIQGCSSPQSPRQTAGFDPPTTLIPGRFAN